MVGICTKRISLSSGAFARQLQYSSHNTFMVPGLLVSKLFIRVKKLSSSLYKSGVSNIDRCINFNTGL